MKVRSLAALTAVLLGAVTWPAVAASLSETFPTDPILNGRFISTDFGTESSFAFDSANQSLTAVLDVDFSAAYYLSTSPFSPIRSTDDVTFSFSFRVWQMDTRILPTAFIGLLTTNHVGGGGDGLTVALSSSTNRLPAVSATVDQGPFNSGGEAVQLAFGTDYLAIGRYSASNLQFAVEIYGGSNFLNFIGRSVANASSAPVFSVDRLGLQNGGGQSSDQTNGSITVVVDNLFTPARPPLSVSITDAAITELNTGTTNAIFTVTLSSPSVQTVRVDYATFALTAFAGEDYAARSGILIFPPGITTQTVVVPIVGDLVAEPTETFNVVLSNAINANLAVATAVGTILDNDRCLVSINDASATEIPGGATNAVFNVSLSVSNRQVVYVSFTTFNDTATAGLDYGFTNGFLMFLPGVTNQTVSIRVFGDLSDEPTETFFIDLSDVTNALCFNCLGLGTITNSTPPPIVEIEPIAFVIEGNAGSTNVAIQVSLSAPSGKPVTVCFATSNGTAVAGSDYQGTNSSITISPGRTNAVISLHVFGDRMFEPEETFSLNLVCATNAVLGNTQCDVIIQNDDLVPSIDVADVSVVEGNAGATNAMFRVQLSNPTYQTVMVGYFTTNLTATSGSDYTASIGSLTFLPGVTNFDVNVAVLGDLITETDESFRLVLTNLLNVLPGTISGTGIITNDDLVCVSIGDTNVVEGDGGTNDAVFAVWLSAPAAQPVTVRYFTRSGTAASGGDFTDMSALLSFPIGVTNQSVRVPVIGDIRDEPNEIFFVVLTNLTNAIFCQSLGTGTIIDDDPIEIRVTPASVVEGNIATNLLPFQITLSSTSLATVTVTFLTKDDSAQAVLDYIATNGTVTFLPGETNKTVFVPVIGDLINEPDESLFLCLTNPVGARLIDAQVQGTITDDDAPCVSVTSVTVREPVAGTTNTVFRVNLDHPSSLTISVAYAVSNDTATAGEDFIGGSGLLIYPPGATNANIVVVVNSDAEVEPNEAFFVVLSNPSNVQICQPSSTNSIIDGTIPPIITVTGGGSVEGDTGVTAMFFNATLSKPSPQTVMVDFSTGNGSALAGTDYTARNGTVLFPPGITLIHFSVPVVGDCMLETNELFFVNLTNARLAALGTTQVVGVITNDDGPPTIAITSAFVRERDLEITNLVFTLLLSCPSSFTAAVSYATANNSALAGLDYIATNGVVVFPPGVTSASITVPVLGDFEGESIETFFLNLSNPTTALLATNRAAGFILDDDDIVVSILDATPVNEGGTAAFTVNLSRAPTSERTVNFATLDASANATFDYTSTNGVLRFPAGVTSQTVSVMTLADTDDETNETFSVLLSAPAHATLGRNQAAGTIIDGNPPCIFINDISIRDNGTGNNPADFIVSLSSTSGLPISLRYTTTNRTAIAGPDYVPASGVLTIPAGLTNGIIHVSVLGNTQDETNEYFSVVLFAPTNATFCKPSGVCTILNGTNVNIPPLVAVTSPAPNLCLTTPTNLVLAATASDSDGLVLRVDFYADATNLLGRSFTVPYQITWINVPAGVHELTAVALDNAEKYATSAPVHLEVRIPAVVSITNATVVEGNEGTSLMLFPIRLDSPSCRTVRVDVATSGGNALAGVDYLPMPRTTITFPPGVTEQIVSVPVLGDTLIEPDETFLVLLTNAVGTTIGNGLGLGMILNDDSNAPPIVIITSPANNAVFFTPPGLIPICADAHASNGFVRQVDFYAGTNFIERSTNAPFCITWTNNVLGAYNLAAIATDNNGARATSAPVSITIQACQISLSATMPTSTVACACSELVIQPVVTGVGPFQYLWKKDGTVLQDQTNIALNLGQANTLRPGVFSVEITGPCNRVTNSTAVSLINITSGQWTNLDSVLIPEFGLAEPYPSQNFVQCAPGPITELRVTLRGLSHDFPDDLDILLVGPDGTAVTLMSDAGGARGNFVTGIDLSFDDNAAQVVPDSTLILTGSYRPADYLDLDEGPEYYPANASELSAFYGSDPNGLWSLYIVDDHGRQAGSLTNGWVLDFGDAAFTHPPPSLTDLVKMENGFFQMKLTGQPDKIYFIEASVDLQHWDIIQTRILVGTSATIIDALAPQSNYRFYRASGCRN